jgi:hypothetical protein
MSGLAALARAFLANQADDVAGAAAGLTGRAAVREAAIRRGKEIVAREAAEAAEKAAAATAQRATARGVIGDVLSVHSPVEAVTRFVPDVAFGAMSAMGPGGLGAGAFDVGLNVMGSLAGEGVGRYAGAKLGRMFGLQGDELLSMMGTGQMIGGLSGNILPPLLIPNPAREAAIDQMSKDQLMQQSGYTLEPRQVLGGDAFDPQEQYNQYLRDQANQQQQSLMAGAYG